MEWHADYERLLKALRCEGEPDQVPLMELGISPQIKEQVLNRKISGLKDEIEFSQLMGYDYIKLQPIVNMNPAGIFPPGKKPGVQIEVEGSIKWANEHDGVIRTLADFENYVFPTLESIDYSRFDAIPSLLPDSMMVIGQYGDIFTMVWEMMGFESFAMALFENPELIKRMFDTIGPIVYSMFENMAQHERVKALWYSDDIAFTSGLMIDPDSLETYLFPWLDKMGELARRYQKPLIYHSDGKLWKVIDRLIECGIQALHPIEPKAMDIEELKLKYGKKLCLVGNIDLSYTLTRGTVNDVEQEVIKRLKTIAPGGGYCLGSANSIPNYVKVENYLKMTETVKRFGRYPINI